MGELKSSNKGQIDYAKIDKMASLIAFVKNKNTLLFTIAGIL